MATTTLLPIHAGKGGSVAVALGRSTDYVKNPDKMEQGELVSAYQCDPITVDAEFLFSKSQYATITGRDYGRRDVLAYHLRQSFKPGETTPAVANRIGYDLAMKLTHGKHAFICCTHVDKSHIHSHIIFNSTNLDCDRKFRNFYKSSFVIRRISDQLCAENGLSIIKNPQPSRGSYGQWMGEGRPPTMREKLEQIIDSALVGCEDFDSFIAAMKSAGCEVKQGKNLAFKISGAERFLRCKSLGDDYTEGAIRERISGKRVVALKQKNIVPQAPAKPNLLIDIEAKIKQACTPGFEHWARLYNLKESAKTLVFLQERGLTDYDLLTEKSEAASKSFGVNNDRRKAIDARLKEITELQKHIGVYIRTKDVYTRYRDSKWNKDFFEAYRADLTLRKAAKKHFDSLGLKKLPTIDMLKKNTRFWQASKKN